MFQDFSSSSSHPDKQLKLINCGKREKVSENNSLHLKKQRICTKCHQPKLVFITTSTQPQPLV
uniref:Uncharacterized protein n=1 Tax=Cucumis melo TaxID=3656 RepID=A0A9I9E855_CUCME